MNKKISFRLLTFASNFFILGMLWALPSGGFADTIYVDSSIGSSSCTTYDSAARSCSGGADSAYRTFSGAAAVTVPGTIVLIRAGTYAEQLRPQSSGTSGNYISFKGYPGETVYFTGSTGIVLSDRSYINIEGINVEDTRWVEARNAHYNIIKDCVFKRTPAGGTTGNVRFISSNYNRVLNNIIEDGQDNLLFIDSNYNLAEGNTIREGGHSIFGIRCGDNNIIRGNYFSNTQQKIGEVYDCGDDTNAVPHSFNSTSKNVIENNIFADCTTYYSTSGGNGIQYSGQEGIIRNNAFYDCNVGLAMQVYGDEALYNTDNRVYHNVFYNNDCAGLTVRDSNDGNYYKNNILAGNLGCLSDCFDDSPGQLTYRGSLGANVLFENNAMFYQQSGQAVIEREFGSGQTVSAFNAANGGILANTVEADPQFTNASAHDFSLQSGSTLRNAGGFLTTTASAGSGSSMTVSEASYLYDGYGIPWEQGDLIQLEGQTATARITNINYNTNVVTLDRSLTWSSGQGVALQFDGSAPDIGLYSSSSVNVASCTLKVSRRCRRSIKPRTRCKLTVRLSGEDPASKTFKMERQRRKKAWKDFGKLKTTDSEGKKRIRIRPRKTFRYRASFDEPSCTSKSVRIKVRS